MQVEFAEADAALDCAEHERRMCFSKFRYLPTWLKEELGRDGLWDDLVQETYATAWEAWRRGLSERETYKLMGRRTYAFLRAYGYRVHRYHYYKMDRPLSSIARDDAHGEKILAKAAANPARTFMTRDNRDNLGEKIMDLLRETPEGISKRDLYSCLAISARELDWHCRPLIEQGLVVEVNRQNSIGRYPTPLLVAVQPGLPLLPPGIDKIERIRQAYFGEGKAIKQIAREFHHSRKTVRKVVREGEPQANFSAEASNRPLEERLAEAPLALEDCPPGVKNIAHKLVQGDPLTPNEKAYLDHFRRNPKPKRGQVYQLEQYRQRKAQGLCVTCGQKADGHARCPECREKMRVYEARYKKEKGQTWQAKLREHWRKEGRCTRCGRAPEPGRKKCSHCLAVDRESLNRWKQEKHAQTREPQAVGV